MTLLHDLKRPTVPPPIGVRETTSRFGFLLRHYWMPATELDYHGTNEIESTGVRTFRFSGTETRTPVRCDSDRFLWRQSFSASPDSDRQRISLTAPQTVPLLCEYDRSNQTFREKGIFDFEFPPESPEEARLRAFLRQPILTPLLPIPVVFCWHVESENGFMNFELSSRSTEDGQPVLTVLRHGTFDLDRYYRNGVERREALSVKRSGRTVYAPERSLILEDRVVDLVRSENAELDGLKIRSTLTLTDSRPAIGSMAPLVHRYRTDSGKKYLYDCGTGHIAEMDGTIDAITDDWRVLTDEEIVRKHADRDEATVRTALRELEELRDRGLLAAHEPRELARVERIVCDGREYDTADFWQRSSAVLILGLTERCNLCCEYCCFSGKFDGQRTHGPRSMSWETARKAIDRFLEGDSVGDGTYPITFYGGEPLLEFELLRRCVEHGERSAKSQDKEVRFAMTTNGTLLSDEAVDFLVEHRFLVLVSFDGPEEAHDRYRLFPNGKGSFETVRRNIERFAERYPDYKLRGFSMTLAPPLDLEAAAKFIEKYLDDYPLSRAGLVNTGDECRFTDRPESPTRYGCAPASECKQRKFDDRLDPFRRFEPGDREQIRLFWDRTVESLKERGAARSWETMPLSMMLFEIQLASYHRRLVTDRAALWTFFVPCLPGLTRRFVDASGNYRVCERVDNAAAYVLGNVRDGLDPDRFDRTMELRRHHGDCGNCPASRFCDVCYVRMPQADAVQSGFDAGFDVQCRETRRLAMEMLKTYTEIMESNPEAFDRPMEADAPRFKKILYAARKTFADVTRE